ncbi:MAG TPA: DNA repair protein RecN [Chitinophagaceae bacterium]|nr:DNA repair protein RecN [Chitinophagaceae bacterium]
MLTRLFIQNYVIIDELEILFSGKLNVITGETGAGKSIIAGALGLILGERADISSLLNKEKKSVIEGIFSIAGKKAVLHFLRKQELDELEELTIRREIAATGKSRAFINDTPVTLSQLQELSSLLVDLHQQFDTLDLARQDFQREVLDALAGHSSLLDEYQLVWNEWKQLQETTSRLKEQQLQFEKEADYNRFQFNELEEAAFRENEIEEAEEALKLQQNAEGIRSALNKVNEALSGSESPLVQQLKSMLHQLQPFGHFHHSLPEILQRMQSAQIELQDIAADLERISEQVQFDPEKAAHLSERISLGYRLQKKHGVTDTGGLLSIRASLEEKLQAVLNIAADIQQKEKETADSLAKATTLADRLTAGRKKQIKPLEEKVNKLLKQVGMPNAQLKIALTPNESLNQAGKDTIVFLFNANIPAGTKGETGNGFAPVSKVASGGELSRLMLCIKSLVAQSVDLPTMIFDEIDTGISGEAARQVGIILKELAEKRQIICITHQPQIAGKAAAHFFVYKEIINDKVKTNIRLLSTDERITSIAKMLSGEKPTAAALENAREMIMN